MVAGITTFFFVFSVVYAIVSRFRGFAAMIWRGSEQSERVYFVVMMSILGVVMAVAHGLSPIFWGDDTLPQRGNDFIFGLDVGRNTAPDGQFVSTTSFALTRLFYPLVNLPFAMAARALGRILFFIPLAYLYFLQLFHIGLMACGGILLARICNITGFTKKYFLALYTVSYSFLLFSLPPEQYVLPTFCAVLLMYVCINAPKAKYAVALAAAGTLTTSLAVFPFVTYARKIKAWILNLLKLGGSFVAICVLYGIFPFFNNPERDFLSALRFAGGSIEEKTLQFINFVGSVFLRPETTLTHGIDALGVEFVAYVLAPPTSVNWIGILLIVLTIAGFIVNRKHRFAQMSILWSMLAVFVLFIVGWQAIGNEMILSSFYFGWAFFVLVFMFFEKLLEKQKIVKYVIYSVAFVVMAVININGIIDLMQFAIQYYPAR